MSKNRKNKFFLLFAGIWIAIFFLIPFISSKIKNNSYKNNKSYISSEFNIKNYEIILDVDKDNKIDVTEKIDVIIPKNSEFNGIYKVIPLWQKYYNDNKILEKKIKITNLRAIGEKFELNKSNDNIGIRVGSKRFIVESGIHTYTIKYRCNMGKDLNKDFDNLVFNLFDNYDNTKIDNMNVTINMPKKIEKEKIKFSKENKDITNLVNYELINNTVKAEISDYLLDESITLNIDLPDGYFVGATSNYGYISLILCLVSIIISLFGYKMWKTYGKNYKKEIQTVEFYPPEDFDSAQIGYIYGEKSIRKIAVSLIIELASKGYISIENIEKNKYKIINIGKNSKNLPRISGNEQLVYIELFKNSDENILCQDKTFASVFSKIEKNLENTIDKRINDIDSRKKMYKTFGMLFISIGSWLISYLYIKDLNPNFNFIYIISFISIFLTGFFAIFMDRKTSYGEKIYAKVLGFRNFLQTAEKTELEATAKENPNYYYDILPFAYVLGVSNEWIGKFDKNNILNIDINSISNFEDNFFIVI